MSTWAGLSHWLGNLGLSRCSPNRVGRRRLSAQTLWLVLLVPGAWFVGTTKLQLETDVPDCGPKWSDTPELNSWGVDRGQTVRPLACVRQFQPVILGLLILRPGDVSGLTG